MSDLHSLLLLYARREVWRRAGSLQLRGPELEDIAQQATDDALMAILTKYSEFRGDSRFTTWAYTFIVLEVSTKMGRHSWMERHVSFADDAWERLPYRLSGSPHRITEYRELFAELRRAIDQDLTDHQRQVFVAIALNEVTGKLRKGAGQCPRSSVLILNHRPLSPEAFRAPSRSQAAPG